MKRTGIIHRVGMEWNKNGRTFYFDSKIMLQANDAPVSEVKLSSYHGMQRIPQRLGESELRQRRLRWITCGHLKQRTNKNPHKSICFKE